MNISKHHIGMRRFIVFFLFAIVTATFFICRYEESKASMPDKLEQAINTTRMNTYQDKFYGYVVHYPSFFEQIPDSLINERGCCKFRFWNVEQIIQTAFVTFNPNNLTVQQSMDSLATATHATEQHHGSDFLILSGPLYIGNEKINGYRFHAKYVQKQKLWFTQYLTYPEIYNQAVTRLIKQIDNWQVWEEDKKKVPDFLQYFPQKTNRPIPSDPLVNWRKNQISSE